MGHRVCDRCGEPVALHEALCFSCASTLGTSNVRKPSDPMRPTTAPDEDSESREPGSVTRWWWTGALRVSVIEAVDQTVLRKTSRGNYLQIIRVKRPRLCDRRGAMLVVLDRHELRSVVVTPEGDEEELSVARAGVRGFRVDPIAPSEETAEPYRVAVVLGDGALVLPLVIEDLARAKAVCLRLHAALDEVPEPSTFRG